MPRCDSKPEMNNKKDGEKKAEDGEKKAKDGGKKAEHEFMKAQLHFRNVEMAKKSFTQKSQQLIQHQQKELHLLEREHEELCLNINLTRSQRNSLRDQKIAVDLDELIEAKNCYDCLLVEEKAHITKLDMQIKEMEKKITNQRKATSGMKTVKQGHSTHKRIKVLETQVHHVTTKFDKVLAKNAKQREMIDQLRFQKATFQNLYQRMLEKLHQDKTFMDQIIKQSILAREKREETEARIRALKERAAQETNQYQTEINELVRFFDHKNKLSVFMQIKSFDRSELDDKMRLKRKEMTKEKDLKEKQEIIQHYQASYQQLVSFIGQPDLNLELLAERFIDNERKNFEGFAAMNEVSIEVGTLVLNIKAVEDDIFNFQSQQTQILEEKHIILKQLEEKLQKTTEEADHYEQKYRESRKVIDPLTSNFGSLFKSINCDPSPFTQMLGGHEGITYLNKVKYFNIIEKKVDELLQIQAYLALQNMTEHEVPSVSFHPFWGSSDLISVVAPTKISLPVIDDRKSTNDSEPKVLGYEELQKQILLDVLHKEDQDKTSQKAVAAGKRVKTKKRAITK